MTGTFQAISKSIAKNYKIRYRSQATTLVDTIQKLESGTENTMQSALQALRYYTEDHSIPSDKKLRVMGKNLRVSSIEIVRTDGTFIRSTNYKLSDLPNLFSFCIGYKKLFTGESTYDHTPLMPSVVDNKVLKFALLPTSDRKYVINIGMEVKYVGDLLRSVMASDPNIVGIGLYTPSGTPLSSISRKSDQIIQDIHPASLQDEPTLAEIENSDHIELITPVSATVEYCCECIRKGLVKDPNKTFYYILKIQVSLGDLKSSITQIRWTLIFAACLGLLVAFILSKLITGKLYYKIDLINKKSRELANLKDLHVRFNISGTDEISNIGNTMDRMLESIETHQQEIVKAEKSKALAEMAEDIAHHIRSPLIAAENALPLLNGVSENPRRILVNALREIHSLTNKLKTQANQSSDTLDQPSSLRQLNALSKPSEKPSLQHLFSLIDSVVLEKKMELKDCSGIEIIAPRSPTNYSHFAYIQPTEFKIALSNLINNAIDAIQSERQGKISIECLSLKEGPSCIVIQDNGIGISSELLPKLGQRDVTYGKKDGSGIGLYHARTAVETWGGTFAITSEIDRGTKVCISLPFAPPPDWFVSELYMPAPGTIVVLDDDTSIHALWDFQFKHAGLPSHDINIIHFTTGDQLVSWVKDFSATIATNIMYLIDYELLGQAKTGLELAEELQIMSKSILVTGRFDEKAIIAKICWLEMKMIPKSLIGLVPIRHITLHDHSLQPKMSL